MSREFIDEGLMVWEAFASGGRFGLPERPKIIFNCLSDPRRRGRFVQHDGDEADAQKSVRELSDGMLRQLLTKSAMLN